MLGLYFISAAAVYILIRVLMGLYVSKWEPENLAVKLYNSDVVK